MATKKNKRKIAVIDFETDPFLHGRIPKPFAWGFYDGEKYVEHWESNAWENNNCVKVLTDFLEATEEPHLILAHNGGKFDFIFFIEKLTGNIRIVNGRILQAQIGNHTLRDSYAILPIPLSAAGGKKEIDYKLMEREVREGHKAEIMSYLKTDCVSLHELVLAFYNEFGDNLTIGSAAMKQLKKFHTFETAGESFDRQFRKFYFGGRCQCFETGVIDMPVKGYDLNSSYPFTMRSMMHPVSVDHMSVGRVSNKTSFVAWEGENFNAMPTREKVGLNFNVPYGVFNSTIHEFNMGLETGTIKVNKVHEAINFTQRLDFSDFVEHFYLARIKAKAEKNIFLDLFYKLILNSSYGKFAQSPEKFIDSIILPYDVFPPNLYVKINGVDALRKEQYEMMHENDGYKIWGKPSGVRTYYNVATAASITGGSRATLLKGLSQATRPLYCDTDSIYCLDLAADLSDKKLGAWKHEFTGSQIAIAGKKLYAVMGKKINKETGLLEYGCLKKASKGTLLNPMAIFMIARGDTCETQNDAPAFKLDGKHQFIRRNISRTGKM